jgi:RNA polymerase sigma factor (sigma-70 family)
VTAAEKQREEHVAVELIRLYKQPIYRLSQWLAAGTGIEDDIFQNAFVRAFRWIRANPTADIGALEGFLRRCARLAAIDLQRQNGRLHEIHAEVEHLAVGGGEASLIAHLDLERFVGTLPEKQRSAVLLTLEGFSENEIAAILGISTTYAGVLMSRGRANLRAMMTVRPSRQERDEEK